MAIPIDQADDDHMSRWGKRVMTEMVSEDDGGRERWARGHQLYESNRNLFEDEADALCALGLTVDGRAQAADR